MREKELVYRANIEFIVFVHRFTERNTTNTRFAAILLGISTSAETFHSKHYKRKDADECIYDWDLRIGDGYQDFYAQGDDGPDDTRMPTTVGLHVWHGQLEVIDDPDYSEESYRRVWKGSWSPATTFDLKDYGIAVPGGF